MKETKDVKEPGIFSAPLSFYLSLMPTNTSFVETDYLWVENLDILNLGNLRGRTQVFPNKDASGQEAQMLTISGQLPFYTFLFSA